MEGSWRGGREGSGEQVDGQGGSLTDVIGSVGTIRKWQGGGVESVLGGVVEWGVEGSSRCV